MKNRHSDRAWISIILVLLVFEIIWLLADFQIIQIPFFSRKSTESNSTVAGHVIKITQELKRRSANSLLWDTTKENDSLYFNDSVLTLSRGGARLYLKDQTELQLSENTLITLEEPIQGSNSEIRLKFSKGDLRARNPFAKTKVYGDEWIVNLEKGTEVSLRKEKDSFEFEVISGKAVLETEKGTLENLNESSILKLSSDQHIQKLEKSQKLQWSDKKAVRVYTYEDKTNVPLAWSGEAKELTISRIGAQEEKLALETEKQQTEVELGLGSYNVRLADENGLSTARTVEVIKAPKIYLKKPLPRDRLKVGEDFEFVWSTEDGLKEYKLKIGDKTLTSQQNFKSIKLDKEDDLEWLVEAIDEDGYAVPAFYKSKIYFREDPLPAPKLKSPKIKINEKPKGTFFRFEKFLYLISYAYAVDEKKQDAYFEWEPVEGADIYFIEISSDPGFRKPEVIEKVKSTEFIWHKYDPLKKYYWRVAAGTRKGRMGIFSEPTEFQPIIVAEAAPDELQLKTLPKAPDQPLQTMIEKSDIDKTEQKLEIPGENSVEKTLGKPAEKEAEKTAPQESYQAEVKRLDGWSLALAPSYKITTFDGEQNTNIQLSGPVLFGLQLEYYSEKYRSKFWFSSETWKPKSTSDLPLQENLTIPNAWLYFGNELYSFGVHQSFIPTRKSNFTISYKAQTILGIRYGLPELGIFIGTSGQAHEINIDYTYKKYLFDQNKYFIGTTINALYQIQKDGGGYQSNVILLLGIDGL